MTQILLCQSLLLAAGMALATDSPADLVSSLLFSGYLLVSRESQFWPGLAWPGVGLYRLLGVRAGLAGTGTTATTDCHNS